jgi:hypothetical protein
MDEADPVDEDYLRNIERILKAGLDPGPTMTRRLVAEVRRLRDALLEYGHHKDDCVFWQDDESDVDAYGPNGLCTCGLDEARLPGGRAR